MITDGNKRYYIAISSLEENHQIVMEIFIV